MEDHSGIFIILVIILGSATVVATLFHTFRLPPLVGFLAAGVLIGPYGLGWVHDLVDVQVLTEIAAILLMFTIGLDFSLRELLQLRKPLLIFGGGQVVLTIAVVSATFYWFLDMPWNHSIFLGCLASLSSSAMVFKLLDTHRDMNSPHGKMSLSILLFQDLAIIPMILLLPFLASADSGANIDISPVSLFIFSLKVLGLVGFLIFGARVLVPFLLERVVRTRSRELFFFCVLFICVSTAYVMEAMNLSLSLGAFCAGVIISESPYGQQATSDFKPFRDNFFGVFFVAIGMLLDPLFVFNNWLSVLGLFALVFTLKSIALYGIVWITGQSSALAIALALILFQSGEFSFILAEQGLGLKLLSEVDKQYLLSYTVLSLGLTPSLYKLAMRLGYRSSEFNMVPEILTKWLKPVRESILAVRLPENPHSSSGQLNSHSIIIGFGPAGVGVAKTLKELEIPFVVLESNMETVRRYQKKGYPIQYGDGSQESVLDSLGISRARLVVVSVGGSDNARRVLHTIREMRPDVPVILRTQYIRESEGLKLSDKTQVVVAEFETVLEVLSRTLHLYGVPAATIHDYVLKTRRELENPSKSKKAPGEGAVDLPAWRAFSYLRPLVIKKNSPLINMSLSDLNLRKEKGVNVVAIYRPELGTCMAHPDFEFALGDVAYLIGDSDALDDICSEATETSTQSP